MTTKPTAATAPITDLILGAALAGFGLLVLSDSQDIPPPVFEQFGAAKLPQAAAILLMAFSLSIVAGAALRILRDSGPVHSAVETNAGSRWLSMVGVTAILLGHSAAISFLDVGFAITTFVALPAMFCVLLGTNRRTLLIGILVAAIVAFGLQYVFTSIFSVDLP